MIAYLAGSCFDKTIDNFSCYGQDEYHTEGEMGVSHILITMCHDDLSQTGYMYDIYYKYEQNGRDREGRCFTPVCQGCSAIE